MIIRLVEYRPREWMIYAVHRADTLKVHLRSLILSITGISAIHISSECLSALLIKSVDTNE